MTAYLIDANVFIQAKNLHYGFDFCPGFWDWLRSENSKHNVFSVEKVLAELLAGQDALADWARERGRGFFVPPDEGTLSAFSRVAQWAASQGYEAPAVSAFLQVADSYIVSHALSRSWAVVTHEIPSDSVRKIKIPNACIELGVRCVSPYEMLREQGARLVLATKTRGVE